jgi:hypothetical protein
MLQDRERAGALGRRLGSDQLATNRHLEPAHRSVDRGEKDAEIRRNAGDGDSFDARTTKQPFERRVEETEMSGFHDQRGFGPDVQLPVPRQRSGRPRQASRAKSCAFLAPSTLS